MENTALKVSGVQFGVGEFFWLVNEFEVGLFERMDRKVKFAGWNTLWGG